MIRRGEQYIQKTQFTEYSDTRWNYSVSQTRADASDGTHQLPPAP